MELALGIVLIWLGAAALWVAFHGTTATTPWGVLQEITAATTGASAPSDTTAPAAVVTP